MIDGLDSTLSSNWLLKLAISTREQQAAVPRSAPWACGQGSLEPSAASLQYPFEYICENAPEATGMMAKEVPTTEMRPVPMWYYRPIQY